MVEKWYEKRRNQQYAKSGGDDDDDNDKKIWRGKIRKMDWSYTRDVTARLLVCSPFSPSLPLILLYHIISPPCIEVHYKDIVEYRSTIYWIFKLELYLVETLLFFSSFLLSVLWNCQRCCCVKFSVNFKMHFVVNCILVVWNTLALPYATFE